MTRNEVQAIVDQQERQCEAKREQTLHDKARSNQDAKRNEALDRIMFQTAFEIASHRQAQQRGLASQLESQAQEKQIRDRERDRLYRNHIDSQYFSRFQTSHR